jgi:hypothetical protein
VIIVSLVQPDLVHDAADVRLDGPLGLPKRRRDRGIGATLGDMGEDSRSRCVWTAEVEAALRAWAAELFTSSRSQTNRA